MLVLSFLRVSCSNIMCASDYFLGDYLGDYLGGTSLSAMKIWTVGLLPYDNANVEIPFFWHIGVFMKIMVSIHSLIIY